MSYGHEKPADQNIRTRQAREGREKKQKWEEDQKLFKDEWATRTMDDREERKRMAKSEYLLGKMYQGKLKMISVKYRINHKSLRDFSVGWNKEKAAGLDIRTIIADTAVQKASERLATRMEGAMEDEFKVHIDALKKKIRDRFEKLDKMAEKVTDPETMEVVVRTEDRLDQMTRRAFEKDQQKLDVTSGGQPLVNQMAILISQCRDKAGSLGNLDRLLETDVSLDNQPDMKIPSSVERTDGPLSGPSPSQSREGTS